MPLQHPLHVLGVVGQVGGVNGAVLDQVDGLLVAGHVAQQAEPAFPHLPGPHRVLP